MNQVTSTAELAIAPGVREVASEDGAVLLDVEQGICFSLNPVVDSTSEPSRSSPSAGPSRCITATSRFN